MILAHIMGIPVEESVLQLAPAGAAMVTAVAIAGRARLGRLRRRLDRVEDARAAYGRALKLVHADTERRFLERRLAELQG
jgi:RNA polymerase sigma-70 factor (ECF subfamily)